VTPRTKSALVLAAVFALGAIAGGGLATARTSRRMRDLFEGPPVALRQRAVLRILEREVDLDGDQEQRIAAIVARYDGEARDLRREIAPRAAAVRGRLVGELRGVMRPEQLAGFQRFADRMERRARAQIEGDGERRSPTHVEAEGERRSPAHGER
jgi:hypothetical protein